MSILIKGMEMPTNEGMEPTAVWVYPNGYAVVFKDNGKMQQYTEAVPVPPHGRCIDADAYESLLRGLGDRNYRREKGTICDAIKFLHPHYAPTILEAEEEN